MVTRLGRLVSHRQLSPYLHHAVAPSTNIQLGMPFIPPESYRDKDTKQYSLLENQRFRLVCGFNAKHYESSCPTVWSCRGQLLSSSGGREHDFGVGVGVSEELYMNILERNES